MKTHTIQITGNGTSIALQALIFADGAILQSSLGAGAY